MSSWVFEERRVVRFLNNRGLLAVEEARPVRFEGANVR